MADEQPPPEPAPDPEAPRARGKATDHTDADLDRLSAVSDADVRHAIGSWHDDAPERFKGLIDAEEE